MIRSPVLTVEQEDDANDVVLRVKGPLVAAWRDDEREIWRATESTVSRLNELVSESLDNLLKSLRHAEFPRRNVAEKVFNEYVRAAEQYWQRSDRDTPRFSSVGNC